MTRVLALVSPGFFDKLFGHSKVEEAFKYFTATGAQPLREDTRPRLPFAGIGRSMEGSMNMQFSFSYVLRPEQI